MTPFRWLVAVGCTYEIVALHERSPLPTLSHIANRASTHPLARVFVWGWWDGYAKLLWPPVGQQEV